jgi:catechol-2,3-dioxygenase
MDVPMKVPEANETVSPAKFAHIVLYTRQLRAMLDWYCDFLGAEVTGASGDIAFLTYDDEHHRVALIERLELKDRVPDTVGMAHFAYSYASLDDLVAQYERMAAKGVLPVRTINHGPTTSLYYRDPDGNAVEIQVDNFSTVDALNDWFASGAFNRNPIGVTFDFDELAAKYHAGVPVAELLRPDEEGAQAAMLSEANR